MQSYILLMKICLVIVYEIFIDKFYAYFTSEIFGYMVNGTIVICSYIATYFTSISIISNTNNHALPWL